MTKVQEKQSFAGGTEIAVIDTEIPDIRAGMALGLAKHLAIVAGQPDGEDSAGRQKLQLLTPPQAAARACDIAEQLWAQFKGRGWLVDAPEPKLPEWKGASK